MAFLVTHVMDGDTFQVKPGWVWRDFKGDVVRPTGYNTPEEGQPGYEEATRKLEGLVLNREVELGAGVNIDHGRVVCPVSINGRDLASYFPEYQ